MDGGILEFNTVQKIEVLRDAETYLKPHLQWPQISIFNPALQLLHCDFYFFN